MASVGKLHLLASPAKISNVVSVLGEHDELGVDSKMQASPSTLCMTDPKDNEKDDLQKPDKFEPLGGQAGNDDASNIIKATTSEVQNKQYREPVSKIKNRIAARILSGSYGATMAYRNKFRDSISTHSDLDGSTVVEVGNVEKLTPDPTRHFHFQDMSKNDITRNYQRIYEQTKNQTTFESELVSINTKGNKSRVHSQQQPKTIDVQPQEFLNANKIVENIPLNHKASLNKVKQGIQKDKKSATELLNNKKILNSKLGQIENEPSASVEHPTEKDDNCTGRFLEKLGKMFKKGSSKKNKESEQQNGKSNVKTKDKVQKAPKTNGNTCQQPSCAFQNPPINYNPHIVPISFCICNGPSQIPNKSLPTNNTHTNFHTNEQGHQQYKSHSNESLDTSSTYIPGDISVNTTNSNKSFIQPFSRFIKSKSTGALLAMAAYLFFKKEGYLKKMLEEHLKDGDEDVSSKKKVEKVKEKNKNKLDSSQSGCQLPLPVSPPWMYSHPYPVTQQPPNVFYFYNNPTRIDNSRSRCSDKVPWHSQLVTYNNQLHPCNTEPEIPNDHRKEKAIYFKANDASGGNSSKAQEASASQQKKACCISKLFSSQPSFKLPHLPPLTNTKDRQQSNTQGQTTSSIVKDGSKKAKRNNISDSSSKHSTESNKETINKGPNLIGKCSGNKHYFSERTLTTRYHRHISSAPYSFPRIYSIPPANLTAQKSDSNINLMGSVVAFTDATKEFNLGTPLQVDTHSSTCQLEVFAQKTCPQKSGYRIQEPTDHWQILPTVRDISCSAGPYVRYGQPIRLLHLNSRCFLYYNDQVMANRAALRPLRSECLHYQDLCQCRKFNSDCYEWVIEKTSGHHPSQHIESSQSDGFWRADDTFIIKHLMTGRVVYYYDPRYHNGHSQNFGNSQNIDYSSINVLVLSVNNDNYGKHDPHGHKAWKINRVERYVFELPEGQNNQTPRLLYFRDT